MTEDPIQELEVNAAKLKRRVVDPTGSAVVASYRLIAAANAMSKAIELIEELEADLERARFHYVTERDVRNASLVARIAELETERNRYDNEASKYLDERDAALDRIAKIEADNAELIATLQGCWREAEEQRDAALARERKLRETVAAMRALADRGGLTRQQVVDLCTAVLADTEEIDNND